MLVLGRSVVVPGAAGTKFDHGAHDEVSGLLFVAHTSRNALQVIDPHKAKHVATLPGFAEAAGVVAREGKVLVTCRGASALKVADAQTLAVEGSYATAPRPNGVAFAPNSESAVVACLGEDGRGGAVLQLVGLTAGEVTELHLPGRPRWCVVASDGMRVFCAVQDPPLVFVASLRPFEEVARWRLPAIGPHGVDVDANGLLFVACDGGELVALSLGSGAIAWAQKLPGVPDATFFNPATQQVHVAIGDPGVITTVAVADGEVASVSFQPTEFGAKTMALVAPDRLFVFLPETGIALELVEEGPY